MTGEGVCEWQSVVGNPLQRIRSTSVRPTGSLLYMIMCIIIAGVGEVASKSIESRTYDFHDLHTSYSQVKCSIFLGCTIMLRSIQILLLKFFNRLTTDPAEGQQHVKCVESAVVYIHTCRYACLLKVWSREEQLSLRDRSLVTVVALMAQGLTDESFRYHLMTAEKNGITKDEIAEIVTHAAFYCGWPKAWAVFRMAKDIWNKEEKQ